MDLEKILAAHKAWLKNENGGVKADLSGANLKGADLSGANLSGAVLKGIIAENSTKFFFPCCPVEGSFIAYKKAHNKIVVLKIPPDAKRSSATTYKCRCDKAKVLRIENLDGSIAAHIKAVASDYDNKFFYTVGEIVKVDDFDNDRWHECSNGIHFFVSRQMAVNY